MISRRRFLKTASLASLCGSGIVAATRAFAASLQLPLGLQLYSVRELLPKDYDGTLKMIGNLGYREVEAAGFLQHSAKEVKQSLQQAKLDCVSGHYPLDTLHQRFDEILAFHTELGAKTIICSSPSFRTPMPGAKGRTLTIDDWHWNADEFNAFGAKCTAAGLQFGYHNHTREFAVTDGLVPYQELLKRTDPSHVTMELDCGWVVVGGASPIEYLRSYPTRITMLHVKDFKQPATQSTEASAFINTELGRGFIDYKPIFAEAAKTGHLRHLFVEQEGFDVPPEESLKIDAAYVRGLMG